MQRVTGIGGIFFKSRDPDALAAWYRRHLGVDVQPWGGAAFSWVTPDNPGGVGTTVSSTVTSTLSARSWVSRRTPSTASSAGCSTPTATRSSSGSRPRVNSP